MSPTSHHHMRHISLFVAWLLISSVVCGGYKRYNNDETDEEIVSTPTKTDNPQQTPKPSTEPIQQILQLDLSIPSNTQYELVEANDERVTNFLSMHGSKISFFTIVLAAIIIAILFPRDSTKPVVQAQAQAQPVQQPNSESQQNIEEPQLPRPIDLDKKEIGDQPPLTPPITPPRNNEPVTPQRELYQFEPPRTPLAMIEADLGLDLMSPQVIRPQSISEIEQLRDCCTTLLHRLEQNIEVEGLDVSVVATKYKVSQFSIAEDCSLLNNCHCAFDCRWSNPEENITVS
jgi:hypothetical protein